MTFTCWIMIFQIIMWRKCIQVFPVYLKVLKQVRYNHKLNYNNSYKDNSNKYNNKENFSSNDKKNDNSYNNKLMINANDNWDNDNNNKKKTRLITIDSI